MDLAELDKFITKLRSLGVRRYVGQFGGGHVELDIGELPKEPGADAGPSEAKRKEDRIRRELEIEWSHAGGPPPFVTRKAFEDAELERPQEPLDEELM